LSWHIELRAADPGEVGAEPCVIGASGA